MTCGIYKITNLVNGKIYIGKSVNIESRINAHKSASKNGKSKLYKAFRKYGFENFKIEILEVLHRSNDILNDREMFWILNFNSKNFGYNETLGGEGTIGIVQSTDHRKKTSQATKRMWSDESFKKKMSEKHKGQNNGMFGKTHSEEAVLVIKKKASEWSQKNKEYIRQKTIEQFSKIENRLKAAAIKMNGKKIVCLENGKIFDSSAEARISLKISGSTISAKIWECCKGKRKTAGGYRWMYYDDWVKTQKQAA